MATAKPNIKVKAEKPSRTPTAVTRNKLREQSVPQEAKDAVTAPTNEPAPWDDQPVTTAAQNPIQVVNDAIKALEDLGIQAPTSMPAVAHAAPAPAPVAAPAEVGLDQHPVFSNPSAWQRPVGMQYTNTASSAPAPAAFGSSMAPFSQTQAAPAPSPSNPDKPVLTNHPFGSSMTPF